MGLGKPIAYPVLFAFNFSPFVTLNIQHCYLDLLIVHGIHIQSIT